MKVINNFLKKEDLLKIQSTLLNDVYFPWYLQNGVSYLGDGHIQFTHVFYNEKINTKETYFLLLKPILDKLKIKKLLRIKANLISKTHKLIQHDYHMDYNDIICTTAIFYINSNDGYTIFKKNKKIIKSKENKFIYFKSNLEHAGTTCTDEKVRVVINFNYI
jgi:hypothetical protein